MIKILYLFLVLFIAPVLLSAQPVIDTLSHGKEVGGKHLLRLQPPSAKTFHYRISTRSLVSAKNSDELLNITDLRPNDKSQYSINYFITLMLRRIRNDKASDIQIHVDSIHCFIDDNGNTQKFTSTNHEDLMNPSFEDSRYAGADFGVIIDTLCNIKELYGIYNIAERIVLTAPDSMQTQDLADSISDDVRANLRKLTRHVFLYLPKDPIGKNDSTGSTWNENSAVWSTLEFPMQKEYKEVVANIEERNGKSYAVYKTETTMTPTERTMDEPDYHTTLPDYNSLNKDIYYIDCQTGMLAYDKWTEDQSYGMKIESKLPEKSGKSFVTVQRSKVELDVELMQ